MNFWPYRPHRAGVRCRMKPKVDGPQVARVVGPEGEEIYCDVHGRIKLQFPWDRMVRAMSKAPAGFGFLKAGPVAITAPWLCPGWVMR